MNMSSFVPNKEHLRHSLLFLFHQKKKAAEAHRLLVETYGEHAPVIRTCETWFRQFKSGDFDLKDNEHPGAAKGLKTRICRCCWMKTQPNHNKNWQKHLMCPE